MKIKKVLSLVLVFMLLLSTTSAFAAVPEGTIVFGNVAYDLQALADDSFTSEILGNYRDNNNDFAYKKIGGEWVNSLNNETTPELPATITLKKGDGTTEIITVEEPTGELKVVEVSAIDATTVEVKFAEALEEDFELEGKEINVGEMVATYVDGTYDAEAKTAQFKLAGEDKLVDAQEYVVTSDWTTEETFVARVADEYVATVEITTTGVQAIEDAKVYFEATNQYGEALELTKDNTEDLGAKARVNGVPLLDNEVVYEDGNDFVTINKELKEGNTLAVQITNEINEEDVVVGEKTFTVVEKETVVATTIGNLKATDGEDKEVTSLAAGDEVKLTVEVLDQYGNPYEADDAEKYVRWVLELGTDLVTATFGDGEAELEFTAEEAGAIKIVAYLANGQNVAYEATIGAAKLTELKYDGTVVTSGNNNEEEIIAQVKANPGAALTPEMIKFDVKALDKDTTADDIDVYAALRKDVDEDVKATDANANDIVIVAKTSKVGEYEITPYVGLAVDDEDAVAADDKLTFKTTVNQEVAKIELGELKENSLTLDGEAKVEVEFTNKHGEVINIPESVNAITNESIVKLPEEEAFVTETDENDVETTYVVLEAKAKGTTSFKLNSGSVESNAIQVTVVDKAKLTTVELGARITEGVIAGEINGVAAEEFVRVIEIKDQYGNDFIPASLSGDDAELDIDATWTGTEGEVPTATFKYYKLDANDKVEAQDTKGDDTKGVVLVIDANNSENEINRVATITVKDADDKVLDTLAVTIQPVRKLTSVTLVPAEATLSEGANTTIVVETKDQYGDFIIEDSLTATSNNTDVVADVSEITTEHKVDDDQIGYKFNVTAKAAGTAVLTVGTDKVNAKVTITVEKAEAGIIDEIRLESDNLDEDGNYKYFVKNTAETKVEFDVKTLKDGKVVTLNTDPTAIASDDKVTAEVSEGKLTVTILEGFVIEETKTEKEVTVTLRQLGVTTSIDLVVSGENAKLVLDTVKAYVVDAKGDDKVIDLAEVLEVKETEDIIFKGVDQYGTSTNLDEVTAENLNPSVATSTFGDGTLTVIGVSKGNATINLLDANLKTLFTVKVKVTEAAEGKIINIDKSKIYESIQEAVDEASEGNTILLTAGTYDEDVTIDKSITLKSLNGRESTEIAGTITITANDVTVEGFTVTAPEGYKAYPVIHMINLENVNILNNTVVADDTAYGAIGTSTGPAKVTGTISGNIVTGMIMVGTDGAVEVSNNNVTLTTASTEGICFYPVGSTAKITVTGNTVGAVTEGNVQIKVNERPESVNGEKSELDMLAAITADNNEATAKLAWLAWLEVDQGVLLTAPKTYGIISKAGLMNLDNVLAGADLGEGKAATVNLAADIDLTGETWRPISRSWFTFNGNGHTISNLTTESTRKAGLFGYAGAVTVKDLTLENVTVTGSQAGVFAGAGEGFTANNCFLKGTNIVNFTTTEETWNGIGAITGVLLNGTVNVTIDKDATVTLNRGDMTTEEGCVYVDDLTGHVTTNKGTVTKHGTVVATGSYPYSE